MKRILAYVFITLFDIFLAGLPIARKQPTDYDKEQDKKLSDLADKIADMRDHE